MLPNLLENRLTPCAFISVGGAAHAAGPNRLAFNRYKDFEALPEARIASIDGQTANSQNGTVPYRLLAVPGRVNQITPENIMLAPTPFAQSRKRSGAKRGADGGNKGH
jgi:hypothetical protein